MKRYFLIPFVAVLIIAAVIILSLRMNEASPVAISHSENALPAEVAPLSVTDNPWSILDWKRPEGPLRVGIQAGHWKYTEAPDELEGVRNNGGGTSATGVPEWQVNVAVAEEIAQLLRPQGIEVDILPATIPPGYWADAFISLHVDGNASTAVSGYKVAAARRDLTGKAEELSQLIEEKYGSATRLSLDSNVTRTMRGYYAFSWYRYEHAIHPMTPGVIIELGFLSNPRDARLLIATPEIPAAPIAEAIETFLNPTQKD